MPNNGVQPPGIRHAVVAWSDDCELIEILPPAERETLKEIAERPDYSNSPS